MPQNHFDSVQNFPHAHARPAPSERLFQNAYIDHITSHVSQKIKDPDLKQMFIQCFPDTLDTTVYYQEHNENNEKDTFIVTGDIPAMWIRDSTNQLWPYARFIRYDRELQNLFEGLINRQVRCLLKDTYANAFERDGSLWERKFELDSLCSFFRLSTVYFQQTGDLSPFNETWIEAVRRIIDLFTLEQQTLNKDTIDHLFRFTTKGGHLHPAIRLHGYGYPGKSCNLVRTLFRPSDDESVFPYLIPANAMAVVELKKLSKILAHISTKTAQSAQDMAIIIDRGIQEWGKILHRRFGEIYAYEVDGFGSSCVMDDPNVPSLLSLPYIGYTTVEDPIYQNTRKLILSEWNSFFAAGKVACGVTSPHVGVCDKFWPMATIMQALTSIHQDEIASCLKILKNTHAHTYFIHESVHVDDQSKFSRHWFSWANSLFGELILTIDEKQPQLLNQEFS